MNTIFTLDLDGIVKTAPFAYQVNSSNVIMYFRIVTNGGYIYFNNFTELSLKFDFEDGTTATETTSLLTSLYNNERLVKCKIPTTYLTEVGAIQITPTVRYYGTDFTLPTFKIEIYDTSDSSIFNSVTNTIDSYNKSLRMYYNAIPKDKLNTANNGVALNEQGEISTTYIANEIMDNIDEINNVHINRKLINSTDGIHGLILDEKKRLCYYDADDDWYYIVNSVNGGRFGINNKPSKYNVSGGRFGVQNTGKHINGGTW